MRRLRAFAANVMPLVRLQKFLSAAGVCSRRSGEKLIRAGRVQVNDRVVDELGAKVDPEQDRVAVDGIPVVPERGMIYIALHKPRGYVTSCHHPGKRIVLDDGRLHHRLSHPSFDHEKEYDVTVERPISDGALQRMAKGLPILNTRTRPAEVTRVSEKRFRIVLKEGRNRQIRRMVGRVGNDVVSLARIRFAGIRLGTLPEGAWRYLDDYEVEGLMDSMA
jgi:pseudouridine synthase